MCGIPNANMTTLQITMSSRIARRAEQGARPAIPTQVAVEKLTTRSNSNSNSNTNSNSIKKKLIKIIHS